MRLATLAIAGLALLSLVASRFVERADEGFILSGTGWQFDLVGESKLLLTRVTRNCGTVGKVPLGEATTALAKSNLPEHTRAAGAVPRLALRAADWLLIETDFAGREPAIFVLRAEGSRTEVKASYGGTAAPFNSTQVIHDHLRREAPAMPAELIKCYEPVGPPFVRSR